MLRPLGYAASRAAAAAPGWLKDPGRVAVLETLKARVQEKHAQEATELFPRQVVAANTSFRDEFLGHQFFKKVAKGTLSRQDFKLFLIHDFYYLNSVAIYFAMMGTDENTIYTLLAESFGNEARKIRQIYEKMYGHGFPSDIQQNDYWNENLYWLREFKEQDENDLMILTTFPCLYLYYKLSQILPKNVRPHHPYADWIGMNARRHTCGSLVIVGKSLATRFSNVVLREDDWLMDFMGLMFAREVHGFGLYVNTSTHRGPLKPPPV